MADPSWLIPIARETWRSREDLSSIWQRITDRMLGKRTQIAVTGMRGAGKTVLLDHLTGKAFQRGYQPPNTSLESETGRVASKQRIFLTTVPGHSGISARAETMWKLLDARKVVDGVIHVVANGFITERQQIARADLLAHLGSDIVALRAFYRQLELEDLNQTLEMLRKPLKKRNKPTWLLLAVAKTDLYYDTIEEAQRYYSPQGDSVFVQKMQEFRHQVGADNFMWDAVPVAAWLEHFTWGETTLKSQLVTQERDYLLIQFANVLEQYCGR